MSLNQIYALSSSAEPELGTRYIGLTMQGAPARLREHLQTSRTGTSICYQWIRRVGAETIVPTVLEDLGDDADLTDLLIAEARWIKQFRRETIWLLNTQSYRRTRRPPARAA